MAATSTPRSRQPGPGDRSVSSSVARTTHRVKGHHQQTRHNSQEPAGSPYSIHLGITLRGIQVRLGLPPKAARTAGPPRLRPGADRQGCGACQQSSTRRRRVPSPPPTVAGAAGSGQAVKGEWHAGFDLRGGGCRTFAPDCRASRPAGTTSFPASLVASSRGGDIPWSVGVKLVPSCHVARQTQLEGSVVQAQPRAATRAMPWSAPSFGPQP
jgi:hypothetical protein